MGRCEFKVPGVRSQTVTHSSCRMAPVGSVPGPLSQRPCLAAMNVRCVQGGKVEIKDWKCWKALAGLLFLLFLLLFSEIRIAAKKTNYM